MMENGLFERMCKDAQDELASGAKGWREADNNTLIMACFGMLSNHLTSRIVKPLWWFVGIASSVGIGYLAHLWVG